MQTDTIAEVAIDNAGRLHVKPSTASFPFIWREAMEVNWDPEGSFLYSPKPREWSYVDWFRQILSAVNEQGWQLQATGETLWRNIPEVLKTEFIAASSQA